MIFTNINYYFLRVINYLVLFILLIALNNRSKVEIFMMLALVLVYILGSQLRMYLLKAIRKLFIHKSLFFVSILVEMIIIIYLANHLGYQLFILMYLLSLDMILYYEKTIGLIISLIINGISLSIMYSINNMFDFDIVLISGGSLAIFILLGAYVKELESKKSQAQNLYDRLRISEGKLVQANSELESYSKTIEELTLLRERTRVSRELHDSVGHSLSALCIQLKAIKTIVSKKPQLAEDMLDTNVKYVEKALEDVRRTVRELKPIQFDAYEEIFTIEEMIKSFSKLTGVNVKIILSKEKWKMTSDQSHHLYRIIQEGLSNALRHGKAKNITVTIQFMKDKLYAHIKDDGTGCSEVTPSFGLQGIKERVKSMRGTVDFYTEEENGFSITVTLPKFKEKVKAELNL